MEQEFLRVIVVTVVVGSLIVGAGAALLYLAFRSFGDERKGERKYAGLSLALVAFLFMCCAVFLTWSLK